MSNLTPMPSYRPLLWPDAVLDLQELLHDWPDAVYIVGGAVRDALKGLPIKDLDLATAGSAVKLARRIANYFPNGALFVMDKERDVARAMVETMHGTLQVDIAHFRGDDGNLLYDLTDRDFTINAMAVDLRGELGHIIDPLNGQQDLVQKILRRCNPQSITSDPVRALRVVRQSAQLNFRIEPAALADVRAAAGLLPTVSAERVRDEFFKILNLARPAAALRVMDKLGLLDAVLPFVLADKAAAMARVEKLSVLLYGLMPFGVDNLATDLGFGVALVQLNGVRKELHTHVAHVWPDGRTHRALLILMALVDGVVMDKPMLDALATSLRLSNDEKARISQILLQAPVLPVNDRLSQHHFWYPMQVAGVDLVLLALARFLAQQGVYINMYHDEWLLLVEQAQRALGTYYHQYETVVSPSPIINGQQLMEALSLKPGPRIGDLLTSIREAQVLGDVRDSEEALRYAARLLSGGR